MKILSIGNSFSQDAHRYLHRVAEANGEKFKCVNLMIGGCTLRTHYLNMLDNKADYLFEFNGEGTGIRVSLAQALASDDWDVVTLQQASHLSFVPESYFPYLSCLCDYVRKYAPHAKIYIHETWEYERESAKLQGVGYDSADRMFSDLTAAYAAAAERVCADGIIPSGTAVHNAIRSSTIRMHRDGFHSSRGAGRYLLALVWYKALTGKSASPDAFITLDEQISDEERAFLHGIVEKA